MISNPCPRTFCSPIKCSSLVKRKEDAWSSQTLSCLPVACLPRCERTNDFKSSYNNDGNALYKDIISTIRGLPIYVPWPPVAEREIGKSANYVFKSLVNKSTSHFTLVGLSRSISLARHNKKRGSPTDRYQVLSSISSFLSQSGHCLL